jgi:hypothetical protein
VTDQRHNPVTGVRIWQQRYRVIAVSRPVARLNAITTGFTPSRTETAVSSLNRHIPSAQH